MDENRPNEPEGQQPPPPRPPEAAVATAEPEPTGRTSSMAVASLVLGILGFFTCGVTALPGLILGVIGLIQTGRERGPLRGHGLALAGTILSGVGVLIAPVFAAILFPVFARAREKARETVCLNNVKRLSTAMAMYQADWDDTYPMASNWNEALAKYAKPTGPSSSASPWVCPAAKDKNAPSYAMNAKLSGLKAGEIGSPSDLVAIYECEPGRNRSGGPGLLQNPPRHREVYVVGFADGHAKAVEQSSVASLIWDPAAGPVPSPAPAPPPLPGQ